MNIESALQIATNQLKQKSFIERARLEAEILLAYSMQQERIYLHAHSMENLNQATQKSLFNLIERRLEGEPIEYLTKSVCFYGLDFFITHGALIPRPETEILLEKVFALIQQNNLKHVAEVGVGSGAVICTLSHLLPHLHFYGSDISESALKIANRNKILHKKENCITFEQCAFLESPLLDSLQIDLLYSNPPYISLQETLPEPVCFEPQEALFGGQQGDEILKELILLAKNKKIPYLACEMGYNQKQSIQNFLKNIENVKSLSFYKDLAGLDRGFIVEFYI